MLNVASPAETLLAPVAGIPAVQAPPGASAGAVAIGSVLGTLFVSNLHQSQERQSREFFAAVTRSLGSVDARRELAEHLARQGERSGFLKGAALEEVQDASDLEQPGLLVRIREREIYTLDVRCMFTPGFAALHVVTAVRLWRKDEVQPAYSARLRYVSSTAPSEQWAADNGSLLVRSIREAMAETARMFVADTALRAGGPLPADSIVASWPALDGKTITASFHVLTRGEGRLLGRAGIAAGGEMLSLPGASQTR